MTICLRNLHTHTEQQVFDTVAHHLLTQMRKSQEVSKGLGSYGACQYRGPHGAKCAAGALISDGEIEEFNIKGLANSDDWMSIQARTGCYAHGALIESLQIVHDSGYPETWKPLLIELAGRRQLDASVPKAYPGNETIQEFA